MATLNRTIVGWKPGLIVRILWAIYDFKSHHSGMETEDDVIQLNHAINFKSHHSGMETDFRAGIG